MSRKGMLSREEADRAAVTGQVARRRMPGVLPTAAKRLYNEARLAGYEVATTRSGTRRPRRGNHPRSASDSTSRTSSACREMDSFR